MEKQEEITTQEKCTTNWSYLPCTMGKAQAIVSPFPRDEGDRTLYIDEEKLDDVHCESTEPDSNSGKMTEDSKNDEAQTSGSDDVSVLVVDETMCEESVLVSEDTVQAKKVPDDSLLEKLDSFQNYSLSQTFTLHQSFQAILSDIKQQEMMAGCQELQEEPESSDPSQILNANVVMLSGEQKPIVNLGQLSSDENSGAVGEVVQLDATVQGKLPIYLSHDTGENITISHVDGKIVVEKRGQKDFVDGHQQDLQEESNKNDLDDPGSWDKSTSRGNMQYIMGNDHVIHVSDPISQRDHKINQGNEKQTNEVDQMTKKNDILNFRSGVMDFQQFNLISNPVGDRQNFMTFCKDQPRHGQVPFAQRDLNIAPNHGDKQNNHGSMTQTEDKTIHFPGNIHYETFRNPKSVDDTSNARIHKEQGNRNNENLTVHHQDHQHHQDQQNHQPSFEEDQSSYPKTISPASSGDASIKGWDDSSLNLPRRPEPHHPVYYHPHHQPSENQSSMNPQQIQNSKDDKSGSQPTSSIDSSNTPVLGWGDFAFNLHRLPQLTEPNHLHHHKSKNPNAMFPPRIPWVGDGQGSGGLPGALHHHFRFPNTNNEYDDQRKQPDPIRNTRPSLPQIIKPEPRHPFQMNQLYHPYPNHNPYPNLSENHENKSFHSVKKNENLTQSLQSDPSSTTEEPNLQTTLLKLGESYPQKILPKPDESDPQQALPKPDQSYPQPTLPKPEANKRKTKRKRQATPELKQPTDMEPQNTDNTSYVRNEIDIKFSNQDQNSGSNIQSNSQNYFPEMKDDSNQGVLNNTTAPTLNHCQGQQADKMGVPPNQFPFLMKEEPEKRSDNHQSYLMQLSNLNKGMNPSRPQDKPPQDNRLSSSTNSGQPSQDQAASSGRSSTPMTQPTGTVPQFSVHLGGAQMPTWIHRNANPNAVGQNLNQMHQPPMNMFPYSQQGHSQRMIIDLRQNRAITEVSSSVPKPMDTKQGTNLQPPGDNYNEQSSSNPSSSSLSSSSQYNHNPHFLQGNQPFSNATTRTESSSAPITSSNTSIVNSIPIGLTPIAPKLQQTGGSFLSSEPLPKLALSPGVGGLAESTPKTHHHIKRSGLSPNNGLGNLPEFAPDFSQGIKKSTLSVSPTNFNLESGILTDLSPENKRHHKRQKLSPLHFPPGFSGRISPFSEPFLQPPQAHQHAHHMRHTSPTGLSGPHMPGVRQTSPSGFLGHHSPVGMEMFPNLPNPYQSFYNPNQMYPPTPYLGSMGHQQQNPIFTPNPMYPPYPVPPGQSLPGHHNQHQMPPPFLLPQQSRDYVPANEHVAANDDGGAEGLNLSLMSASKPRSKQNNQTSDEQRSVTKDNLPQISPKTRQHNSSNRPNDLTNMDLPDSGLPVNSHVTTSDITETTKRKGRINYSSQQLSALDSLFNQNPYPGADTLDDLSSRLDIPTSKLKVWFQNKRARARKKGGNKNPKLAPPATNVLYNNIKTSSQQPLPFSSSMGPYPSFYNHGNQSQNSIAPVTTSTSSNNYPTPGIHGNSLPYNFDQMKPPQVS